MTDHSTLVPFVARKNFAKGRPTNAERGLVDLFYFAREVMGFDALAEDPHKAICDTLARRFALGPDGLNQALIIPRDHLKSTIGRALVMWLFTRHAVIENDLEFRTLIDTSTLTLSKKDIRFLGRQFQSNKMYRSMYGDFYGNGDGFSERQIYVKGRNMGGVVIEPNFMASGIKAEVTGLHFDLIWPDDLSTEQTAYSKHMREKVIDHYENLLPLLSEGGKVFYTATPWHDADLTGFIRDREEERANRGDKPLYDVIFRPCYNEDGSALFPSRWPLDALAAKKDSIRAWKWSSQYLLNPVRPEDAIPFDKTEIYVSRANFPQKLRLRTMTIDPNFRHEESASSDNGAFVIGGFDRFMKWWGIDVALAPYTAEEFLNKFFELLDAWKPQLIKIEEKFASFINFTLRERANREKRLLPRIYLIKRDNESKQQRYSNLHPLFAARSIHFAAEIAPEIKKEMEDELERVGTSKYDDFMDALSDQFRDVNPATASDEDSFGQPEERTERVGLVPGMMHPASDLEMWEKFYAKETPQWS
jgi:hypothetical protein